MFARRAPYWVHGAQLLWRWVARDRSLQDRSMPLGTFVALACLVASTLAAAQPPVEIQPRNIQDRSVEYWVEQLASNHYLRRETAQQQLIKAGDEAVQPLEQAMVRGDLETTELAIRALGEIAMAQAPDDDSGAWAAINRIATRAAGSKASRAKLVVEEIGTHRSKVAVERLVAGGVYVGSDDFVVQAISTTQVIVQISDTWNGDLQVLEWLRWVQNIQFARVQGAALQKDVLSRLVKMPDLRTIALVDGDIDDATLEPLKQMRSIHSLEIRYVPINETIADQIAKLPIRSSLTLMGTDLASKKVAAMREELPGLKIEYKQGGFLGVQCTDGLNACQINVIVPGSGAQLAGLQPGDVIIKIGDIKVDKFLDLRQKIDEHSEGDELPIEFLRLGQPMQASVTLGRLRER